jgi:hypothetical protein
MLHPLINYNENEINLFRLPLAVNASNLRYLSYLKLHCISNICFHRSMSLLSSVFGQLNHLSLQLELSSSIISGPLGVSFDIIQQLCLDHLNSSSKHTLQILM